MLSIQLYTMRSLNDLDRILEAVAEAGFRHVETVGAQLDDAATTRAKLDAHGLQASSSHVGLAALRARPDAVVEAAARSASTSCSCPRCRPNSAPWRRTAGGRSGSELGGMSDRLRAQGIELGYHNHHWELAPKEGATTALELLFAAAGNSPLTWQADVAWLVRGGVEPTAWLDRYRGRVTSAHVKDLAPAGQNRDEDGWADVGAGTLDWRNLWPACRDGRRQMDGGRARQAEGPGPHRARELRLSERHGSVIEPWTPRPSASSAAATSAMPTSKGPRARS